MGTAVHCYFSQGEDLLSLVQTPHVSNKSCTGFDTFSFKIGIRAEDFSEKQHETALNWDSHAVDLHGNPCAIFSSFFAGL